MAIDPIPTTSSTVEQIASAFASVRNGDLSKLSDLVKIGPPLATLLAPYLVDSDENVRREVVSLLSLVGGNDAIPLLAKAVSDVSMDVSERASLALYERFDPDQVAANTDAARAILGSINAGNPAGTTLVLAGYIPGAKTEEALRKFLKLPESREPIQFLSDSNPVTAQLPALLALARLGDKDSMSEVAKRAEHADGDEWLFLLAAIRDVNAPRILHAIKEALDDPRETSVGVPSHAAPKRRVCDEALNALVERLSLKPSFPISTAQRYSPQELAEARRLIDEFLPK